MVDVVQNMSDTLPLEVQIANNLADRLYDVPMLHPSHNAELTDLVLLDSGLLDLGVAHSGLLDAELIRAETPDADFYCSEMLMDSFYSLGYEERYYDSITEQITRAYTRSEPGVGDLPLDLYTTLHGPTVYGLRDFQRILDYYFNLNNIPRYNTFSFDEGTIHALMSRYLDLIDLISAMEAIKIMSPEYLSALRVLHHGHNSDIFIGPDEIDFLMRQEIVNNPVFIELIKSEFTQEYLDYQIRLFNYHAFQVIRALSHEEWLVNPNILN